MSDSINKLAMRAAGLGAVTGFRSMSGLAFFSYIEGRDPGKLDGTPYKLVVSPEGTLATSVFALGEIVVDKLPFLPPRTKPGPLLGRIGTGAFVGSGVFRAGGQSPAIGAAIGGAAALATSFLGAFYRIGLAKALHLPDFILALGEDAATLALGFYLAGEDDDFDEDEDDELEAEANPS